ncbi:MAG: hypothetical protein V4617_15395 [Gemmatimonadota bacterium]
MRIVSRMSPLLAALAMFTACSSDSGTAPITTTPAIGVTATTAAATIARGATATYPITVTRSGGYTGSITLTAEGLPANVTAAFAPATLANGATSSTLSLTAAATAAAGTNPNIVVRATGTGVSAQTTQIALTVADAPSGFTLAGAPTAVTVAAGQSGTSTITLARQGTFAGAVDLTVQNAPAGVTATFAPAQLTGATLVSTLSLATTSAVTPGVYNLTVRGTSGTTNVDAAVALTVTAAPAIGLILAPSTLTISQSQTGTTNVLVERTGGATGNVTLALENAPAGVTASYQPSPVTGSSTNLTVSVGAAVPAGTYNLTLRGTSTSNATGTTPLTLTVQATAAGSFAMNANPSTVSIPQGANEAVTTINIGRTNFTGAVNLSISGLPAGITATFSPTASPTGTQAQLGLIVASNVAVGTYNATILGTATGLANVTVPITVNVTPAQGNGTVVAFRFCSQDALPTFLAYRNGSTGFWSRVTVSANNTYNVTFTGAAGQVAYAVPNDNGGVDMTVLSNTTAEFPGVAAQECIQNPATRTVNGTVAGLGAAESATITLGNGSAGPGANGPFTITGATDGVTDLLALRSFVNINTGSVGVNKLIVRRGINAAAGGSIGPVLDFNAAEAVAPASAAYTVNNVNGDMLQGFTLFETANGGSASFFNLGANSTSPLTLLGVPANLTQAGDLHTAFIAASTTGATTTTRAVLQFNRELTARTITLGAAVIAPTFSTLATAPYARIRTAGTWQADYGDAIGVSFTQSNGQRSWTLTASRAFLGATGTFELDIPDLSAVTGFNNAWGLVGGTATNYSFTMYGGFQGITVPTEGSTFRFAARSGTITP